MTEAIEGILKSLGVTPEPTVVAAEPIPTEWEDRVLEALQRVEDSEVPFAARYRLWLLLREFSTKAASWAPGGLDIRPNPQAPGLLLRFYEVSPPTLSAGRDYVIIEDEPIITELLLAREIGTETHSLSGLKNYYLRRKELLPVTADWAWHDTVTTLPGGKLLITSAKHDGQED